MLLLFLKDIDECEALNLCENNGTCINMNGSYQCMCKAGWSGRHCEKGSLTISV